MNAPCDPSVGAARALLVVDDGATMHVLMNVFLRRLSSADITPAAIGAAGLEVGGGSGIGRGAGPVPFLKTLENAKAFR